MPHAYPRHVRFASSIQQIIAPLLVGLLPTGLVTVTRVSVTPDLSDATVHYSVMGTDSDDVRVKLDKMTSELRKKLAGKLGAKRVPRLSFKEDLMGRPDF